MVAKASEVAEGELFAFAGIWDRWRDQSGKAVETCSILTTIQTLSPLPSTTACQHPDSYDLWLDPGMKDVSAASELLKPYDSRPMRCYPVSTRVNHVANDDEGCCRPVQLAQIQNSLFA